MTQPILLSFEGSKIAIVTLNRPESYNALSKDLLEKLHVCLLDLADNLDISAVIFTGAGEKAFCAGADLKERLGMSADETLECVRLVSETMNLVELLPVPTIAALNGVAFGGGLELALACDIRLMHEQAKVGLTECALGIIPGAGGTQRLPRIIGPAKAKEMIFCAKRIGAKEAKKIGLVNSVCKGDVRKEALILAKCITECAPISLRAAKDAINVGQSLPMGEALVLESRCYERTLITKDRLEGLKAFSEKRKPEYIGA